CRIPRPQTSALRARHWLANAVCDSEPAWLGSGLARGRSQRGSGRWLRIRPPVAQLPRDSGAAGPIPPALVRPPHHCITNARRCTDGVGLTHTFERIIGYIERNPVSAGLAP